MKVDLGQCAVCGAKNSKYVEKCYKCGAALPWAPDFVAPKNAPQPVTPQPVTPQPVTPQPVAAPADSGAKTVVVTPQDATSAPNLEPAENETAHNSAARNVSVPAWALGAGGLGLVVLGMGLWALLAPKPAPVVTPVMTPTPIATMPALAPIVPTETAQPTVEATASPTVQATIEATTVPTASPTVSATQTAAGGVGVVPEVGPSFDELYANLTTGTPQQRALYWDSVKGQQINWRGEFVSLGNAATGPLVVQCKSAKGSLKVTIRLDATQPQTLPSFATGQSLPFSGILESQSAGQATVKEGRVS